jgi:hypothetical protein
MVRRGWFTKRRDSSGRRRGCTVHDWFRGPQRSSLKISGLVRADDLEPYTVTAARGHFSLPGLRLGKRYDDL